MWRRTYQPLIAIWAVLYRQEQGKCERTPLVPSIFHKATLHPLVIGLDFIDVVQVCHRFACVVFWYNSQDIVSLEQCIEQAGPT